ncbi:MAG: CHASE domain-containing protein, partial [Bacteroidetes bacterium]|nr:CHASE domain-containing protein [Bacteroidota bacterium]
LSFLNTDKILRRFRGRRTKDEGRRTKDEGRRTKDEGRRTKDEGRMTKIEKGMKKIRLLELLLFSNPNFQNNWKSLVILLGALSLTLAAVFYAYREEAAKEQNELLLTGNELKAKISARLHDHALLLRSGSALFASSDTVTRKQWKAFVEAMKVEKNLQGIQGLGFAMIIPENQLQQYTRRIRGEGFPDFTVKPMGYRPVYTSITYLEPFSGRNLRAFGYDMLTESTRRKAMESARDYDLAILSGKVILVQETNENVQPGTLMYVPVYRNGMPVNTVEQRRAAIKGWVYSPHRMIDLMQGILGRWDTIIQSRIHFQVYDSVISANSLLYDSQINDRMKHTDNYSVTLHVDFHNKNLILYFTKSQEQTIVSGKVIIILASGIVISLLLFMLSLSLFSAYYRVQHIAGRLASEIKISEERFEIILNSTAEGIYGLDHQGKCTFSNTAGIQLLGYEKADQLVGKDMHRLVHHSKADGTVLISENCRIHLSLCPNEKIHVEDEIFWRADGSCFPVEYWSYPVFFNGEIQGSVVTFFDITERKRADHEMLKARNEAEKANRDKTAFLSRMSHELRTPMNSILGFAQLMEMGELKTSHKKWVNHILNNGRRLLSLINEVLDISDIESGAVALTIEPVKINHAIQEMLDVVSHAAGKREQTLSLVDSPANQLFVLADKPRLKQVLVNLTDNAIKYNSTSGTVTIKTEIAQTEEPETSRIRISISDTGMGIAAGEITRLFQPFERIGAEKTEIEGTGLGLVVVKKLVDAMGGNVGVESVPGKGSSFWIELPQTTRDESRG